MIGVIYRTANGEIVRSVDCPDALLPLQIGPGEACLEGDADDMTHYVENGALVAYTPEQYAAKCARPAHSAVWSNATFVWEDTRTIQEVKSDARQRMTRAWSAERAAGVTVGGKVAPSDSEAWTRYLVIRQIAEEAGWTDVPIPLIDGTFELLTLAKAQALWAALKGMERTLLTQLRDRVDQINAATTIADVNAVTW